MSEYRSKSCLNYTAYVWIYMGVLITIVSYAADMWVPPHGWPAHGC